MDLSRFASGVRPSRVAPRPGLQIDAAGNGFRPCSLRRARHCGGGNRNLMVAAAAAAALRGRGGLFYLPTTRRSPHLSLCARGRPRSRCQGNDSLAYVDGPLEAAAKGSGEVSDDDEATSSGSDDDRGPGPTDVDCLREMLHRSRNELEMARLNSTMFEEKAQRISESAIALKDR